MAEIVTDAVNEVDLRDAVGNLEDIARMAGAYYAALSQQGMPAKLVHDMMMQWQQITLMGEDDCEPA